MEFNKNIITINNNCETILKQMIDKGIKVDAVITDPPYELKKHGGMKGKIAKRKGLLCNSIENMGLDIGYNYENVLNFLCEICKIPNIIIFCSNQQISKTMKFFEDKGLSTTLLIWHKTNAFPLGNLKYVSDIEYIIYVRGKNAPFNNDINIKYKSKVKSYPFVSPKKRIHVCEKPVELLEELINLHTFENDIVLDPFMGSGSTGIACKNLNRKFIGIELNKDIFDKANNRFSEITKE